MRQSVQRRQFVADHVGRPVLSDAHRDEAVESHRRREHEIGHQVVVVLVLADFGCDLDERLQNAFGPTIHHPRLPRDGHILLHDVHEGIGQSAGHLPLGQREGLFGIEYRKERVVAVERIFLLRLAARDDGAVVHLRACGRDRQHRTQRYGALRSALAHQFPCIAVVEQSCRDEFRAVDDRTAAHGQQEIDFALLAQCDRLAQRLDRRVGFDAPELDRVAAREGGAHLVVDAVAPDRAAAESHHHALAGWNQLAEPGDHPLAEDQLRGVLKNEILHNFLYRRFTCLCTDRANAAILKRIHPSLPPISSAGRTPWDVPSSRGRPCRRSRSPRFRASSQAPKRRP